VINLASLPDAPQQPAARGSAEPPAQKPDIRLSRDVIAGHKQGVKAPLEQLAAEDPGKKTRAAKRSPIATGGLSGFTGDKAVGRRRTGAMEPEEEEKPRRGRNIPGMESVRPDRGRGGKRKAQVNEVDRVGADTPIRRRTLNRRGTNTAAPRKDKVVIELPCSIRSFSESAGVGVAQVLRTLMGMQMMVNINSQLDVSTAELLAAELGLDIELKSQETLEDELITQIEEREDAPESMVTRPPIVTFLGHVDHGKTSLLDFLTGTKVASGEAGGITQHIRAYAVNKDGRRVTFVDTPGHEAFTEMRARGANVTDIAVLVIAADDGIMPQTEEAISHIKAAEVPIVVALNKVDIPGVDPNRVLTQLTEHHLTPSEWGGDVEVVRTSAVTGAGMDELLDTLLTVAEMHEYTANPNRQALGVCLESEQHGERGVIAKLIVQNGTLKVGDILVCGDAHGRVRAMHDPLTKKAIKSAEPSTPVNVIGLDIAPGAGVRFHVLNDISQAREIAANRASASSRESLAGNTTKVSFENFQSMLAEGRLGKAEDRARLNVIVRADVRGSLEAIEKELSKFDHPEVELRILQRSVGGVSLADVTLASASDAVILAFNVIPDDQARSLAEERNIEIRRYNVIYKLADDIRGLIEGKLKPEERVVELGRALVKQVFQISRVGAIAGCYVLQGSIQRGCRIRVNRDSRTIGDYALDSLKRIKEDVKEVPRGMECGIRLQGFNDIKQDDVLEAYKIEEVARKLEM
jgi:translation initiation factor IF-2